MSEIDDENGDLHHNMSDLIEELGIMASRDALRTSHLSEGRRLTPYDKKNITTLCHFASAASNQTDALAEYLFEFTEEMSLVDETDFGIEPFSVPAALTDPKTGDLLVDPVQPSRVEALGIFVEMSSLSWFESQDHWPLPPTTTQFASAEEVKAAVENWVSGEDLLPTVSQKGKGKSVSLVDVTLHHENKETTWQLPISTTTRTLYSLANRATHAKYQYFGLRLCDSKADILNSATLSLGTSDLSEGGRIELYRATAHRRGNLEVLVEDREAGEGAVFLLPRDASVMALKCAIHHWIQTPLPDMMIWHGLKDRGDGQRRGSLLEDDDARLQPYDDGSHVISFECHHWYWISSGAQRKREQSKKLSRLDLLKELFNVFLNRAASFDTSVSLVLGLVTFSNEVRVEQELSPIFENFRQQLDRVTAEGDTAIYDALEAARRQLVNYRPELKALRRRIIIVTDGQDTCSTTAAKDACYALQRDRIIVDSVQVGGHGDGIIHAISVATGGYRLSPNTSLSDALSIFDLETMLHSGERPARRVMPAVHTDVQLRQYSHTGIYPVDVVTVDTFPERAPHGKMEETVTPAANTMTSHNHHAKDDRTKRIMRELKLLVADPHPQIDLYVNEQDISFLKIILEAPKDVKGCPYEGGCFLLTCEFPAGYPRDPPEIRFVTFILHPNVSKQGKVCVAELGRLWSSDITVKELLSLVYGLLLEPDLDNPLEIQASLKYYDDDGTYALAAANAVAHHARKARDEWRMELEPEA